MRAIKASAPNHFNSANKGLLALSSLDMMDLPKVFDDAISDYLLDIVVDGASLADGGGYGCEVVVGQNQIGGRLRALKQSYLPCWRRPGR